MAETTRDADQSAAEELALDMGAFDAAKFLRSEIGFTLTEGAQLVERLAAKHPESNLAASLRRNGGSFFLRKP